MHKMTYTVTKTYTKQDDATFWPWEKDGYGDGLVKSINDKKLVSVNLSEDGNTATSTQVWSSKSDYEDVVKSKSDAALKSLQELWVTYMALNNISCRVVRDDGSIRVFNSSSQSFEAE